MIRLQSMHYNDGDYGSAFKYFKDAAELGDVESH